jgi:hypothetical protein
MTCKKTPRVLLGLFASLLTLAASGDDINLYRLAMPCAFAQSPLGSFPLDDENTDFIQSSPVQMPRNQDASPGLSICSFAAVFLRMPYDSASPFVLVAATQHNSSYDGAMTPLRC